MYFTPSRGTLAKKEHPGFIMAMYAIGDVQGCYRSLQDLLIRIRFNSSRDRLWFVGDLVNRGPDSLRVLHFVKNLGSAAVTVLGNHDVFLLAVACGIVNLSAQDTIGDILSAPDREELLLWVRRQHLFYRQPPFVFVHAGLLPQWSIEEAHELALEAEEALQSPHYEQVLRALYPSKHLQWSPDLRGPTRVATIIKVLTRLRACSVAGVMESSYSGPPDRVPAGFLPWFRIKDRRHGDAVIVHGHWASLGLYCEENLLSIDSGCVWGRQLTAVRLEDRQVFQVACNGLEASGD